MFCGFNIKFDEQEEILLSYLEYGKELYDKQKRETAALLDEYVIESELIGKDKIEKDWFPHVDADVFLSHSHNDRDLAVSYAGWLYKKFGISAFIDSCVWGYSDKLLRSIDSKYCVSEENPDGTKIYDYEKRNNSTSHVHMILCMALMKMIDSTECLMFINTPNSLLIDDVINGSATKSPWIYSELMISRLVEHRKLRDYRPKMILEYAARHDALDVKYDVKINHLIDLPLESLLKWSKSYSGENPYKALDTLYELVDLEKLSSKQL